MKLFLVGGTVRDHLLGAPASKDLDFAVEADSFDEMHAHLVDDLAVNIWQMRAKFVTLRGSMLFRTRSFGGLVGRGNPLDHDQDYILRDADFTLCRAEAMYSDKRHPDVVTPADLRTDLSRRDFTVNAVAVAEDGTFHDPFDGRGDAESRVLRAVGDAHARFTEDPLRMLRALRFSVRHQMSFELSLWHALNDVSLCASLRTLPHERVREELTKMLAADWLLTCMHLTVNFPSLGLALREFFPTLWLKATTEDK